MFDSWGMLWTASFIVALGLALIFDSTTSKWFLAPFGIGVMLIDREVELNNSLLGDILDELKETER